MVLDGDGSLCHTPAFELISLCRLCGQGDLGSCHCLCYIGCRSSLSLHIYPDIPQYCRRICHFKLQLHRLYHILPCPDLHGFFISTDCQTFLWLHGKSCGFSRCQFRSSQCSDLIMLCDRLLQCDLFRTKIPDADSTCCRSLRISCFLCLIGQDFRSYRDRCPLYRICLQTGKIKVPDICSCHISIGGILHQVIGIHHDDQGQISLVGRFLSLSLYQGRILIDGIGIGIVSHSHGFIRGIYFLEAFDLFHRGTAAFYGINICQILCQPGLGIDIP